MRKALVFCIALAAGCSWGKCVLGELKASYQALIADVTEDLATTDYTAALIELGKSVGEDAVNCTVAAIVAHEQDKVAAKGFRAAPATDVQAHGQAWIDAHPQAKLCRVK